MIFRPRFIPRLILALLATAVATFAAAPRKFDLHEIVLSGNGDASNPFDTIATVRFTPPSGSAKAVSVQAFFDGDNTWRARVYVSEPGNWRWTSQCATDRGLDGKSGTFTAEDSQLRGRLLVHPKNPRQWMTENGRWFLNLNDTAYFLLSTHDARGNPIPFADFEAYVRDAVDHGITSFRCFFANDARGHTDEKHSDAKGWLNHFADSTLSRLRFDTYRETERRLRWLGEHFPDVYVQVILYPRGSSWRVDEEFWHGMSLVQKERVLRYSIARLAAFPQVFWLIVNDAHYGGDRLGSSGDVAGAKAAASFTHNIALAREVGKYFKQHDPWRHPISTGHARTVPFYFGREDWATYVHLEDGFDLGARTYAECHHFAKPVFLGEDRYEQDRPDRDPLHMRYFQRRLFWSWLLAGGSTNYGGRWWVVQPYTQTGRRPTPNPWSKQGPTHAEPLTGLDSVRVLRDYFVTRRIELSDFEPDHRLVRDGDGRSGVQAPKLARRQRSEFLIYHPNASVDGRETRADAGKTARLHLDLTAAPGRFAVEWFRAADGVGVQDGEITGAQEVVLAAPWPGEDVVVRLLRR